MGNSLTCGQCAMNSGNCTLIAWGLCPSCQAARNRREKLHAGGKFTRRTSRFGISTGSESLMLRLSDDGLSLTWRTLQGTSTGGQVQLVNIASVQADGAQSVKVTNGEGEVVLELEASSVSERNAWVTNLTELVATTKENPLKAAAAAAAQSHSGPRTEAPSASLARADGNALAEAQYWRSREAELKARDKERKAKREQYAGVGMKYTAQAMANKK